MRKPKLATVPKHNLNMEAGQQLKHFVLVHGACHGAWSWYKLKPLLESAGHRVTALDLSASGINPRQLDDVRTLCDYNLPLIEVLASLPPEEKVILVGHSLGGLNLALAMDKYPEKVLVAVFVTAFMPDSLHGPSYVLNQFLERTSAESWLDTQFSPFGDPKHPITSMFFGPKFLSSKLYQLCSIEDLTLATTLIRPGSLFVEDLSKASNFSNERYGSLKRVFIVCCEDKAIPEEFQQWMIKNSPIVTEVKEIKGADHMPMLSKRQELCHYLLEIATKYA
ncbi:hypothetical protein RJ639_022190 [Escallonia herrerae]|uniref:AB hydrolase-1 domain-containing protein n=1 Tax=Escallonia herrerae TaxID=1293975 RepID=A0AA88V282_9ASTE|nr:hypothetical protein RJ639_022190 [Escallonia herrerae]